MNLHAWQALGLACALSACSPATESNTAVRPTGADRDAQGCIGSAGYTWSPMRGQCIRPFEAGLAFLPDPAPTQGAVLAAYVVLSPAQGDDVTAAELFLPRNKGPVALTVVHTPEGDIRPTLLVNPAEGVQLWRYKDDHVLDVKDQRYRRQSEPGERLFLIR